MKQGNTLAFSDYQANRIKRILNRKNIIYRESASFGYLSFLFNDRFLFAVKGDNLEIRLHPENVSEPPNIYDSKFVVINKFDFYTESELESWIDYAISPFVCTI